MAENKRKDSAQTGMVRTAGINPEQARRLAINTHFRFSDSLPTISNMYADGVAVIDMPVGEYTYRAFALSILSTAAIAGVTVASENVHRVQTDHFADYIDSVAVEVNGRVQLEYTVAEWLDLNEFMRWNVQDGYGWICFGGPGYFRSYPMAEDAYLLGTSDVSAVRVLVKLKPAWNATLKLNLHAEYAPVSKPIGYVQTLRTQRYVFAGSGEQTISDIPHGIDLSAIWVRNLNNKRIDEIKLAVDGQIMFECDTSAYQALSELWGKDHSQIGSGNVYIDFWRDGDPNKGLASLTASGQVRRNADIRLTLRMGETGAEIKIISMHCGLWRHQR